MNLDTKLIDAKLNPKNQQDFQNIIKEQISVENMSKFKKIFASLFGYLFALILLGIGIAILFLFPKSKIGSYFAYAIFASGIGCLLGVFFLRKKIVNNAIKNFDWIKVFGKWLSFFGVSQDEVFMYDSAQIQREKYKMFRELSCAPSDARIDLIDATCGFTHQGISTSFARILWHWTRQVKTKNGYRTEHYYEKQFFVFEDNLNPKWKDFEFSLTKGRTLFRKKHETLENDFFNKAFNYNYNDPIKLRLLFKLSTQERILMKWKNNGIVLAKKGSFLTIAVKQRAVSSSFTPFVLNVGAFTKIDAIKDKLVQDLETDFQYLMYVIGHARLLDELYKKIKN